MQAEQVRQIIIDEEFKALLPALDPETFRLLEENILQYGCRDAIVLWEGILIDGHNRYKICTTHDIPFDTMDMAFASREEVLIWIISTQVSRRNLTPLQLSNYRGLHYRADKKIQGTYLRNTSEIKNAQNGPFQNSTANKLAKQYKVSRNTIRRDEKLAEALTAIGEASPEAKRMILAGEASIGKRVLQELPSKSKEEIEALATMIEDGTYEKKKAAHDGAAKHVETLAQPWETRLNETTESFYAGLRTHSRNDDTAKIRAAFRAYIDALEALFAQI